MDDLQKLAQAVQSDYPEAELSVDPPASDTQAGWLDIRYHGKSVAVEWRRERGFGVSLLADERRQPCAGLFEGPDEVFPEWRRAHERIFLLLGEEAPGNPSRRQARI
jgi:hypothetical protein